MKSRIFGTIILEFLLFLGTKYNVEFLKDIETDSYERIAVESTNISPSSRGIQGESLAKKASTSESTSCSFCIERGNFSVEIEPVSPPVWISDEAGKPIISAKSAIVFVPETGQILFGKNIYEKKSIASLTKMVTSLTAMDEAQSDYVRVPANLQLDPFESQLWLLPNETFTFRQTLEALMIPSSNEAAWMLAGGYKNSNSEAFIEKMNQKALDLGAKNTQFKNPVGLDEEGHYSTSFDLAIIATEYLKNDELKEIASIDFKNITSLDGNTYALQNTNQLLYYPYIEIEGIKTGTTDLAGQSLVTYFQKDGYTFIGVILGSEDRFQEMKALLSWTDEFVQIPV